MQIKRSHEKARIRHYLVYLCLQTTSIIVCTASFDETCEKHNQLVFNITILMLTNKSF